MNKSPTNVYPLPDSMFTSIDMVCLKDIDGCVFEEYSVNGVKAEWFDPMLKYFGEKNAALIIDVSNMKRNKCCSCECKFCDDIDCMDKTHEEYEKMMKVI